MHWGRLQEKHKDFFTEDKEISIALCGCYRHSVYPAAQLNSLTNESHLFVPSHHLARVALRHLSLFEWVCVKYKETLQEEFSAGTRPD